MSYVAMHFVKVNGKMYTEGEIIDEPMDEAKVARLIAHGAIREETAPVQEAPKEEAPAAPVKKKRAAKTKPEPKAEPETEADEEAEAPEIDVLDGIVGAKRKKATR